MCVGYQMFKSIKLDPANQRFSGIMANAKRYSIPRFQRDYAWNEEQWLELWRHSGACRH